MMHHERNWEINQLGMRNAPLRPKLPDEFRILCIEDSQTFELRARQGHTFADQLERELIDKT